MRHRLHRAWPRHPRPGWAWTASIGLILAATALPAPAVERHWVCGTGNWASPCWAPTLNSPPNGALPGPGEDIFIEVIGPPLVVSFTAASSVLAPLRILGVGDQSSLSSGVTFDVSGGYLATDKLVLASLKAGSATWRQSGGEVQVGASGLTVGSLVAPALGDFLGTTTFELQGGLLRASSQLILGSPTGPSALLNSGGLNVTDVLSVGGDHGPNSRYALSATGQLQAGIVNVGGGGDGRFEQTGGTALLGTMRVGNAPLFSTVGVGVGVATLGAGLLRTGTLTVGDEDIGRFEQSGGTLQVTGTLTVGLAAGVTGTATVTGGSLQANSLQVGLRGSGSFQQQGGSMQVTDTLTLGQAAGSYGSYTLDAGTLRTAMTQVGWQGQGSFEQSAGEHIVSQGLILAAPGGSQASYLLKGGTLRTSYTRVADAGNATFVQLGGEHIASLALLLAGRPGSQASYVLAGGRLSAGSDIVGGEGISRLVLAGGELAGSSRLSVSQLVVQANSVVRGPVSVAAGQVLQVAPTSTAEFTNLVELGAGALLAGSGTKVFAGGLTLDPNGITQLADPGSVRLAPGNRYTVRIGAQGLNDHLSVAGSFTAGGELRVRIAGYAPQAGDRFDFFDWGLVEGSFTNVRLDEAVLAPGLVWDLSQLSVSGELVVAAVPEAPAGLLLLAGLSVVLPIRRTRNTTARTAQ